MTVDDALLRMDEGCRSCSCERCVAEGIVAAEVTRLRQEVADSKCPKCGAEKKIAPVQGYAAGIPWSMHMRAYDAYCKRHGRQQAMIEGGCRGGFATEEL